MMGCGPPPWLFCLCALSVLLMKCELYLRLESEPLLGVSSGCCREVSPERSSEKLLLFGLLVLEIAIFSEARLSSFYCGNWWLGGI